MTGIEQSPLTPAEARDGWYVPRWATLGPPWWDDRPVIILGAGSSIRGIDIGRLRDLGHVLAINGAMRDAPFASAWFTLDFKFVMHERAFLAAPGPELWIAVPEVKKLNSHHHAPLIERARYIIRERVSERMFTTLDRIEAGASSGHGALNMAFAKRARLIVLLGFDYAVDAGGEAHYCPERYWWHHKANDRYWPRWARSFDATRPQFNDAGVRVVTAIGNPPSAVTAFERMPIDEALAMLDNMRTKEQPDERRQDQAVAWTP